MTSTNPAGVLSSDSPSAEDVRDAERTLALIDAKVRMATMPQVRIIQLGVMVVLTVFGVWLRRLVPLGPAGAVIACALLLAFGLVLPSLSRRGRKEPRWVWAVKVHRQSLDSWIPKATLDVFTRYASSVPRRETYVYVSRCTDRDPAHFGVCHMVGVLPTNRRLLVVLGEHVATEQPAIPEAILSHESRHVTGVRLRLGYVISVFGLLAWVIVGWALPWPALLAGVAVLQGAALILAPWMLEVSCDLGSARAVGAPGMLQALDWVGQALATTRAAEPRWRRYGGSVLAWMGGPAHPPLPVRRAVIRWLVRPRPNRIAG